MVNCSNCGKPVDEENMIELNECFGAAQWGFKFHGWRCLADFMLHRQMIEVVVRAVGPDESGGSSR